MVPLYLQKRSKMETEGEKCEYLFGWRQVLRRLRALALGRITLSDLIGRIHKGLYES